jgi:hypothetical protein
VRAGSGDEPGQRRRDLLESRRVRESPLVKKLLWSGLLAGLGAGASIATTQLAELIWKRAFGEEPPE